MGPETQARPYAAQRHYQALDCRSFWRAGSFDVNQSSIPGGVLDSSDFERARVHPKFLHTNATSHKWAFGAVAELLDNAVDEICNSATFVIVDKVNNPRDGSPVLVFQDDGGGMNHEGIRQCMSLGYSSKTSKKTIGQYGNGFKTSTMRLGADAIVFTRAKRLSHVTQSVGLLSYTFLRRTLKDDIIVPMVDFEFRDDQAVPLFLGSQEDWHNNLKTILEWSPFSSREELMKQFEDIGSHGTKVLVYNLWMNDDGLLELDFDDDDERKSSPFSLIDSVGHNFEGSGQHWRPFKVQTGSDQFPYIQHPQAYTSILYLQKFSNFQIILRGRPVEQLNIADELKFRKILAYKPQIGMGTENVLAKVTVGFAKEAPILGVFGVNVYHKNRLIMPFWKVLQEGSSRGRSVIGVLEANFIEPTHDKQDFERTPLFLRLEARLKQVILDFWKDNCHLIGYQSLEMRKQKGPSRPTAGRATYVPQGMPHNEHVSRISAREQSDFQVKDSVIEHPATAGHVVGLAAVNGTSTMQPEASLLMDQSVDSEEVVEPLSLDSSYIEKISGENIELFTRREELQSRNAKLKETIDRLEHELERWRRKCARLAKEVEIRRKLPTTADH